MARTQCCLLWVKDLVQDLVQDLVLRPSKRSGLGSGFGSSLGCNVQLCLYNQTKFEPCTREIKAMQSKTGPPICGLWLGSVHVSYQPNS